MSIDATRTTPAGGSAAGAATAVPLVALVPRLRRYARVLTIEGNAADDLVAATLERATALRASQRCSILSLMALMHRLHRRGCAARPSRERAHTPPGATRSLGAVTPPGIAALLLELPLEHREVLLLVAVEGLAYGEVATLLDVPAATVIARLGRARANLRDLTESVARQDATPRPFPRRTSR
jgi:RNA polymerase sigma-70 factor (ECF subfamily)